MKVNLITNISSNIATQIIIGSLGILSTPFFISVYGSNSFGIIQFLLSINSLIIIVDLGLATTINRRTAMMLSINRSDAEILVEEINTLLSYYIFSSFIVGLILVVFSKAIAREWLGSEQEDTSAALVLWSIVIALRFPLNFINGIINGSGSQHQLNKLTISINTTRTILLLAAGWITKTVIAYIIIFIAFTIIEFVWTFKIYKHLNLPKTKYLFKWSAFSKNIKFALGISLSSMAAFAFKGFDKIILSGLITLDKFGMYQAIYMLSSGIPLISMGVIKAYYPKLSSSIKNKKEQQATYLEATNIVSSLTFALGIIILLNAKPLLKIYTHNDEWINKNSLLFTILIVAMIINSVMQLPQYLAWSSGKSYLTAYNNWVLTIFIAPIMYWGMLNYQSYGAAISWLLYNILYFLFFPRLLHNKICNELNSQWYFQVIKGSVYTIFIFCIISTIFYDEFIIFFVSIISSFILVILCMPNFFKSIQYMIKI